MNFISIFIILMSTVLLLTFTMLSYRSVYDNYIIKIRGEKRGIIKISIILALTISCYIVIKLINIHMTGNSQFELIDILYLLIISVGLSISDILKTDGVALGILSILMAVMLFCIY